MVSLRFPFLGSGDRLRRYHPSTRLTQCPVGVGAVFSTPLGRDLLGFTAVHSWREPHPGCQAPEHR